MTKEMMDKQLVHHGRTTTKNAHISCNIEPRQSLTPLILGIGITGMLGFMTSFFGAASGWLDSTSYIALVAASLTLCASVLLYGHLNDPFHKRATWLE